MIGNLNHPEIQMSVSDHKRKINVRAFMEDYMAGRSARELCERHSLSNDQLRKALSRLKARGDLGQQELQARKKSIDMLEAMGASQPPEGEAPARVDLDTGLVLHCPSCGASVKRDSERCRYCDSPLDFSLKGKTTHCPHCFQKIPANSRFCMVCARPAETHSKEVAALRNHPCPRCEKLMQIRDVGGFSVAGCPDCQGLFIPPETFEMMQDASKRIIEGVARQGERQYELDYEVVYLNCPVCGKLMNRRNFAASSGVIIDVCGEHGIWFDKGEMEKIMDFVAKGGIQKARKAELERLKDEAKLAKLKRERIKSQGGYSMGFDMGSAELAGDSVLGILENIAISFMRRV
jgi:Zn-finger nucleic acid-binding protein